mgnify:CR=1 FL=1
MEKIPLTVLAHEGPGSRAYLAMMAASGFKPSSIILMISTHGEPGGNSRPVGKFMPRFLRSKYARKVQEIRRMYWPRRIRKEHPSLYSSIAKGLAATIEKPREKLDEITGAFTWNKYSDDIKEVMIKNYRDPAILQLLIKENISTVLYTGGGILPTSLIHSRSKFIHIHPGKLPYVRGADGLLWSTLVRGRPGATCFYMDEKIDTGDIIKTTDLNPTTFEISDTDRPNDQTLYRAIFSFYDPILRAKLFSDILTKHEGRLPHTRKRQSTEEGITYHFMHPAIREKALKQIFIAPSH